MIKSSKDTKAPEGYKKNPEFIEKREKRVNLLLQPSVYEAAKAKAAAQNESFNEYVHKLIVQDINNGEQ